MFKTRKLQSSNVKMDIKSIPVRFVLTVALTIVAVTNISAVPIQKTSQAEVSQYICHDFMFFFLK